DYSTVNIYKNTISSTTRHGVLWQAQTQTTVATANIYDNTLTTIGSGANVVGIQTGGAADKTATNVNIYSNTITTVASSGGDAYGIDLDIGTSLGNVYFNKITSADEAGICCIGSTATGNSIYYNLIITCGKNGSVSQAGVLEGTASGGNAFYNNVLYDCYIGYDIANNGTGSSFKNNIIYGSDTYHIKIEGTGSATLDYNCYFPDTAGATGKFAWQGSDSDNFADWQSDSGQDAVSMVQDPFFVDAANADFHLKSNSPVIGLGRYESSPLSRNRYQRFVQRFPNSRRARTT
ncbi:MAG: hypothetical protein ACYTEO_15320, partial [Planctomycetota bacterium]